MAWFRVDDGFDRHPKTLDAGNAAIGLWVRCGCYSAHYGLDGAVPIRTAQEYGRSREAAALVDSGLWIPTDTGYVMPDFLEYNPSGAEQAAKREADAERKRQARARAHLELLNGHQVRDAAGKFGARRGR